MYGKPLDPQDRQQHRIYNLKDLIALPDPIDEWLVPPMVPLGGRTFAFGQGSVYKTEIMLDLSMAIASGGTMLNQFEVRRHGPVLINSVEGTLHGMKRRVLRQLRCRPWVNPHSFFDKFYFCPEPFRIEDPYEFDDLRRLLDKIRPVFLLLDPLDSFLEGNENDPTQTRTFRRRCDILLREHYENNMSLGIIHHSPVSTDERMRGTTAWRNWADAALQFKVVERHFGLDRPKKVLSVKSDKQREEETGHLFTVVPLFDAQYGMTTYAIYDNQDDSAVIESWFRQQVYKLLRDTGACYTAQMLKDELRVGHDRLNAALRQLEQQGYIAKDGSVQRSTSADGSRSRSIPAWRAIVRLPLVDAVMALTVLEEREQARHASLLDISVSSKPAFEGRDLRVLRLAGD